MTFVTTVPDGSAIDPDSLSKSYNYNSDGSLNYAEVTDGSKTYRQTYTWANGNLTSISAWTKQ